MKQTARPAPDSTALTLLQAGRRLFARHGYDGTSIRAITSEAGANLGAVTYHFGTKRTLYERVLESFVGPLAERVLRELKAPSPVLERIDGVIRVYFDYLSDNPEAPHLMMQELVLSGGEVSEVVLRHLRPVYGAVTELIREGQRTGVIRAGDPALMPFGIISQPVFLMLMRRPLRAITGQDLSDAAVREQFVTGVTAFVRGGLAARPGGIS